MDKHGQHLVVKSAQNATLERETRTALLANAIHRRTQGWV